MPGLYGMISKRKKDENENQFNRMHEAIAGTAFLESGKLVDEELCVYVGWTCHKDSFSDCMPVWNEKRDIVLIFVGENFCDPELLDELKRRHHKFNRKDCSYIIHMYEEWGGACFKKLNGSFHGIIIDKIKRKVILFNDRHSLQTLYYHEAKDVFYFSSQIKRITEIDTVKNSIRPINLAEYFKFGCVLNDHTIFDNVKMLPEAVYWVFEKEGRSYSEKYFDHSELENQSLLEKGFFYERLKHTLINTLKRYFKANDQIGIHLEDTLDCKIILDNAQYGANKLPCYNIQFKNTDQVQMQRIIEISKNIEQHLEVVNIDDAIQKDYFDLLKETVLFSDGAGDAGDAITYFFYRSARNIAPIQISHDFGGVLLRKAEPLKEEHFDYTIFNQAFLKVYQDAGCFDDEKKRLEITQNLNNAIHWRSNGANKLIQSQMTVRHPYLDNDLIELIYRAPDEALENNDISVQLGGSLNVEYYEQSKKRHGIRGFIEKCRTKTSKREKNEEMYKRTKREILHFLYNDRNIQLVKDILLGQNRLTSDYISEKSIEKIIKNHSDGKKDFTNEINRLVAVEMLQYVF